MKSILSFHLPQRFWAAIVVLALSWGCGEVPIPEPGQAVEPFRGDFETGSLAGFHLLVPDTAVNTQVVSHPVRKGNFALKNTLRPGDYIFHGHRAELSVYHCAEYQSEVYYGFSFMIDSGYTDTAFNLICQWQDLPDYAQGENWEPDPNIRGSSPPLALVYVDGNLELKLNENARSNADDYRVGDAQPIQKGQWQDVVAHIYWDMEDTAFMEVWLNGVFITPFNGTDYRFYRRNLFNRAGNYFKFGQYRGPFNTTASHTVYFDEVKVGSSYAEVAP